MSEEQRLAEGYRAKADELRIIAAEEGRVPVHDMLMKLARDYERMARTLETLDIEHRGFARRAQIRLLSPPLKTATCDG